MSTPQPLLHNKQADWTHRSTSPGSTPSRRWVSTRSGHTSPAPYGLRCPQMSSTRSTPTRSLSLLDESRCTWAYPRARLVCPETEHSQWPVGEPVSSLKS